MNSEIDYDAIRERIAELMGNEKPYPWGRRMGLAQATFNRFWAKREVPKLETLHRIAIGAGVSLDWLIYGSAPAKLERGAASQHKNEVVPVPILSVRASAGPGSTAGDESDQPSNFIEVDKVLMTRLGLKPHQTSALTIQGDSALPTLSDGDLVLVDRSQDYPQDGLLYVIGIDNDLVVKRIHRLVDGGLLLKSDNASYDAQRVTASDAASLRIIGRVKYALHAV